MNLYFAPLEGITSYTYRNAHKRMFGYCDAYFAPFINPSDQERVSKKGMRDILPENNEIKPKVQVLTNNYESFLKFSENIKALGYEEVNINLGCPVQMVTKKGRGSGFLKSPDELFNFFCEIFKRSDIKISVKTRIGFYSAREFAGLLEIYNKYPISELIIHPRIREQFYKGVPDMDCFSYAYKNSVNKICYNGDIWDYSDYINIRDNFSDLSSVMLGRGAIKNPAIFREIKGGEKIKTEELLSFTRVLSEDYLNLLKSETFTLYKLKEIWVYMLLNYPEEQKLAKEIKKANNLNKFLHLLENLPEVVYEDNRNI